MTVPVRMIDLALDACLEPVSRRQATDCLQVVADGLACSRPDPGEYSPSPTMPPALQPVRCANLPLQTITPRNPISANLRSSATNYAVNGSEFWSTVWYFTLRTIEFTLNSHAAVNVTLSLVMRTCLPFAPGRGHRERQDTTHVQPSDDTWFTQHVAIPAGFSSTARTRSYWKPRHRSDSTRIPLDLVQSASVVGILDWCTLREPDGVCPTLPCEYRCLAQIQSLSVCRMAELNATWTQSG